MAGAQVGRVALVELAVVVVTFIVVIFIVALFLISLIGAAVARLTAAGATVLAEHHGREGLDHVVLADPEGNEFCLLAPSP